MTMSRYLLTITIVLSVLIHAGFAVCLHTSSIQPPRAFAPDRGKWSIALKSVTEVRQSEQAVTRSETIRPLTASNLSEAPMTSDARPADPQIELTRPPATAADAQPIEMMHTEFSSMHELEVAKPMATDEEPMLPATHAIPADSQRSQFSVQPTSEPPPARPAVRGSRASRGADVDALPQPQYNPTPPYPLAALQAGRQGTVVVRVKVDARGNVESARVRRSSGDRALDDSAVDTLRSWKFEPARKGDQPVPFAVLIPVEFVIP